MTKSMVTTIFVGSLIAIVGGVIVAAAGVGIVLATGTLQIEGPDVTGFQPSSITPAAIGLVLLGGLAILGGSLGQFVAWIGAVVNTARLDDKTWFVVLLVLGLLSFGFVAMLVYVLAGPDGTAPRPAPPVNPNSSPVSA
jgi:energy-converting hydrogenase Eha subunit A